MYVFVFLKGVKSFLFQSVKTHRKMCVSWRTLIAAIPPPVGGTIFTSEK